jgi:hypothetical protein
MIYIPSFVKTGSGIQKLVGGGGGVHRQHGDLIGPLLFFKNKESRLKPDTLCPSMPKLFDIFPFSKNWYERLSRNVVPIISFSAILTRNKVSLI